MVASLNGFKQPQVHTPATGGASRSVLDNPAANSSPFFDAFDEESLLAGSPPHAAGGLRQSLVNGLKTVNATRGTLAFAGVQALTLAGTAYLAPESVHVNTWLAQLGGGFLLQQAAAHFPASWSDALQQQATSRLPASWAKSLSENGSVAAHALAQLPALILDPLGTVCSVGALLGSQPLIRKLPAGLPQDVAGAVAYSAGGALGRTGVPALLRACHESAAIQAPHTPARRLLQTAGNPPPPSGGGEASGPTSPVTLVPSGLGDTPSNAPGLAPSGLAGSPPSPPPPPPPAQPPVAQPPAAQPPAAQPPVAQPPVAQPPVAQPPVAQPPVAQPPVAQPPVAQPPVAQPPVAQPPVAQPPVAPPNPAPVHKKGIPWWEYVVIGVAAGTGVVGAGAVALGMRKKANDAANQLPR